MLLSSRISQRLESEVEAWCLYNPLHQAFENLMHQLMVVTAADTTTIVTLVGFELNDFHFGFFR